MPGVFSTLITTWKAIPIQARYTRSVMATTTSIAYAHITKDPNVCGRKACVDGTRISVMDIVALTTTSRAALFIRE